MIVCKVTNLQRIVTQLGCFTRLFGQLFCFVCIDCIKCCQQQHFIKKLKKKRLYTKKHQTKQQS